MRWSIAAATIFVANGLVLGRRKMRVKSETYVLAPSGGVTGGVSLLGHRVSRINLTPDFS